jgi:hypothetical protein
MKNYICISNIIIALFLLTLQSCESKFILDPIDPRLPKYTETGNNVAGALVNQDIWKSVLSYSLAGTTNLPVIKVYSAGDSLVISFEGDVNKEKDIQLITLIKFHLKGLNIHTFSDIRTLKDKTVQLDGVRNWAEYTRPISVNEYPACTGSFGIGQIYFRNVVVNDANNAATLSGTFGFTIPASDCGSLEVSYGRFDYRFNDTNILFQ